MGCLRIWCAYCMLKIWKSKCMKYLRYLPTIVVCRSIIFVTAGINSPFTVCGMFCWSKTKLPNSVSFSCWAQVFVCVPPSLFKVFCSLSPPVPHCSVSSPPLPLSLETHGGEKARESSLLTLSQLSDLLPAPASHFLQQIQQFHPLPSMNVDAAHLAHNDPEEKPASQLPAA